MQGFDGVNEPFVPLLSLCEGDVGYGLGLFGLFGLQWVMSSSFHIGVWGGILRYGGLCPIAFNGVIGRRKTRVCLMIERGLLWSYLIFFSLSRRLNVCFGR